MKPTIKPIANSVQKNLETMDKRARNPQVVYGVPYGFEKLDRLTHGIQEGEMTLLLARAGVGKSAFSDQVILNAALYLRARGIKKVVRVISLDSDDSTWSHRMACKMSGVLSEKILTGFATQEERDRYEGACEAIANLPIEMLDDVRYIEDVEDFVRANTNVAEKDRTEKTPSNCYLFVLDHFNALPNDGFKSSWDKLVFRINDLARNVAPGLVLIQSNRSYVSRENKRPETGDIAETSALERATRLVIALYREDMDIKNVGADTSKPVPAEVIILKANNIETTTLDFTFTPNALYWKEL